MKWLNGSKIKMVLVVFVVAVVLGGGSAYADFTFGTPTNLGPPIWSSGQDPQGCCFSHDGLELYFASNRPGEADPDHETRRSRPHRLENLEKKPRATLEPGSPVTAGAAARREELVQQVAVAALDIDELEALPLGERGGPGEALHELLELCI